jgi:hypothetical protein
MEISAEKLVDKHCDRYPDIVNKVDSETGLNYYIITCSVCGLVVQDFSLANAILRWKIKTGGY